MPITQHSFLKMLWIREGAGRVDFAGTNEACESGDLVLVPAGLKHRIIESPRTPIALYGLGIDFKRLNCVSPVLSLFKAGIFREPRLHTLRIEQRIRKIVYLNDQTDRASQFSGVAATLDLLAELALVLKPPKRNATQLAPVTRQLTDDPLLEAYLAWLHRNFYEPLTLDGAANACGMSRRTFTSHFKLRTGKTWLEYLNSLRIQHAVELLKQTDRKVTSIAFQCGFEDLTTFYRAFKRIHRKCPQSFR
jgi:AraC family L-rhamnose operon regulatory protein RhaS